VAFAVPERLLHGEHEWLDRRWISRLQGRVPVHSYGSMQEPRPQQIFCNCARLDWVELIMLDTAQGRNRPSRRVLWESSVIPQNGASYQD
jgi:hypothetical protein